MGKQKQCSWHFRSRLLAAPKPPALRHSAFRKHGGLSGLLRLRNDVITGATRGGGGDGASPRGVLARPLMADGFEASRRRLAPSPGVQRCPRARRLPVSKKATQGRRLQGRRLHASGCRSARQQVWTSPLGRHG